MTAYRVTVNRSPMHPTTHGLTPARERALWDYAIIGCSIAVGVGVVVVTWGGIL